MKERQPLILQPFKLSDPKESLEYLESFLRSSNEEEIVDYCLKNYQGAMCDYDYYEASIMWYKYKQVFEFDATTFHEITIADKIKEILENKDKFYEIKELNKFQQMYWKLFRSPLFTFGYLKEQWD